MGVQAVKAPAGMAADGPAGMIERVAGWLALWRDYREARRERGQLLAMSDRDLRDLGISRIDAFQAAQHSFWRRR